MSTQSGSHESYNTGKCYYLDTINGVYGWYETGATTIDTFELASEGRLAPYARPYDYGGPFALYKVSHIVKPTYINKTTGGLHYQKFIGNVFPGEITGYVYPGLATESDDSLRGKGTTLVNRAIPTAPQVDLATTLAELMREGTPSAPGFQSIKAGIETVVKRRNLAARGIRSNRGSAVVKDARTAGRTAGSEYLNYQFGIAPLVREFRDLMHVVADSRKIVDQYRKGSDTHIRRRRALPEESNSLSFTPGAHCMAYPKKASIIGNLLRHGTQATTKNTWFSGAFRYHIPISDNQYLKILEYEAIANRLLGLRLTPEVIWELTPWSWLVDWHMNMGDIMSNISLMGRDGLVMTYGYAMQTHETTVSWSMTPGWFGTGGAFFAPCDIKRKVSYKRRISASPFGFWVEPSAYTLKQISILAALGLSKI